MQEVEVEPNVSQVLNHQEELSGKQVSLLNSWGILWVSWLVGLLICCLV